jgi:hypothetical protein
MKKQVVKKVFDNNNMGTALEALGKSIARWTDRGDQLVTAIPGLSLFQRDEPTQPESRMYEPRICLIAQGAKRVLLGDDTYVYGERHFLITSVNLPTVVQIIKASREKPCLGLILKLDQREISQLMVDSNLPFRVRSNRAAEWRPARLRYRCSLLFNGWSTCLLNRRISRFLRRSSSGKSFTVYWWAIKVHVCAR